MTSYDAVVVGGGIVGASTAYHLARAGTETLLLDREDEGRATDAGAGILSPATSSRTASDTWFEFGTAAVDYYPTLVERLEEDQDGPTSYERPGSLSVAVDPDEVEAFDAAFARIEERQERLGKPESGSVERLDGAAARERFPPLASVERAFYYENAGRVDGRVFAEALLAGGRAHGLTIEHADVTEIVLEHGSVTGIRTADGEHVRAERVVVAGGAWSSAFGEQLGLELPVEPKRGQIAHLRLPEANTEEWSIVGAYRGHYIVPWDDGRVAIGATREAGSGFDPRTTAAGVREVLEEGLRVAPGLADAEMETVRVGLRPVTPDGLPVLGSVPDVDGVFLATGHGPTGLQLGPYSGKLVADLARGAAVERSLEAFSASRFD